MRPGTMRGAVKRAISGAAGAILGGRGALAALCLLAAGAAAGLLSCGGCGEGGAAEVSPRADLILIGATGPSAEAERPPVQFPHDAHTEALSAKGKDCSTCHPTQEDGYLSPLFMRVDTALMEAVKRPGPGSGPEGASDMGGSAAVGEATAGGDTTTDEAAGDELAGDDDEDGDGGAAPGASEYGDTNVDALPAGEAGGRAGGRDELMDLYHDNCLACHTKMADEGEKSGPLACGDCHRENRAYVSSARPFGMDKSLHYRHQVARKDKCEDCHHTYDEAAGKLVYKKGTESSCRDCHEDETENKTVAFKVAAHWACIKCHIEASKAGPDAAAGPRACGGCHDPEKQGAIKVVENVPRLKRDQPDFVLISAPEDEMASSMFRTVPFPHREHESATASCRGCHHETLKSCTDCHTLPGEKEGEGVTLRTAMHVMTSTHSCIGCHDLQKEHQKCAGCHDLMEKGRISEHACPVCHAGPSPQNLKAEGPRYTSMAQFEPPAASVRLTFTATEIPDSVVISVLSKDYEPAVMPHGRIVNKLREYIKDSKVATHFHGREDVMCEGCHHNGSIGDRPALCENCHGRPFDKAHLYRPGLYGAYHRQCLGCHESMGLQKPSDCAGCHRKKEAAAGQSVAGDR
jgi:hypothetical protein